MPSESESTAQPSLTGQNVYLRPLSPRDIESQHQWRSLSEMQSLSCRTMSLRTPEEESTAYRHRTVRKGMQGFAVCLTKDGRLVGSVSYFALNVLNRSAELGLIIDPEQQRRKYGAEALRLLIDYLFDYMGLYRVHAQTGAFNKATVALLESLGFRLDACLRSHYFFDGEFHDGLVYSFLLSDR